LADLPRGDFGSGLAKLEPLFGPAGHRFLAVDVDTVFAGCVLDTCAESYAPFIVDNEQLSDADCKRLYFDSDKLREIDPQVQSARTAFNAGARKARPPTACRVLLTGVFAPMAGIAERDQIEIRVVSSLTSLCRGYKRMAPPVGLEPTTFRLTA
jgi:hypothetical protein